MATDLTNQILQTLAQARNHAPELRFGQLIAIIGELARDEGGLSLWDVEDAESAAALERFASDLANRKAINSKLDTADYGRGGAAR
jgi:hypothetical protein